MKCVGCLREVKEYFKDAEHTQRTEAGRAVRVGVCFATGTRESGMITDEVCRVCVGQVVAALGLTIGHNREPLVRIRTGLTRPTLTPEQRLARLVTAYGDGSWPDGLKKVQEQLRFWVIYGPPSD